MCHQDINIVLLQNLCSIKFSQPTVFILNLDLKNTAVTGDGCITKSGLTKELPTLDKTFSRILLKLDSIYKIKYASQFWCLVSRLTQFRKRTFWSHTEAKSIFGKNTGFLLFRLNSENFFFIQIFSLNLADLKWIYFYFLLHDIWFKITTRIFFCLLWQHKQAE